MTDAQTAEFPGVDVDQLLKDLSSKEAIARQRARFALVELGAAVVPAVAGLANASDSRARWECAKTLAAIADPAGVDALVLLLDDSDPSTSWDASEGLVAIGQPAVTPLLRAIIDRSNQFRILAGAHNAVHEFCKTAWGSFLKPVYAALDGPEPAVEAPVAANAALQSWEYSALQQ